MYQERVIAILERIGQEPNSEEKEKMFEIVSSFMESISNYMTGVCVLAIEKAVGRENDNADEIKKTNYERLCKKISKIDQLSDVFSLPHVYDGNQEKSEIDNFCVAIMDEYFQQRLR